MKNYIKLILTLILTLFFKENSSASQNREIIRAFEKGKPAKMDIEITKVRSDNFIEFYIDKVEKKIYRDITQKTREIEDLDKKLYITTYLKPNTKTNTIHDELPYKIVTRDSRRYLEISYSKEPEKIYLWVLKNDKVQKLYTGIFKEIKITTRADGAFEIFSSINSKDNEFSLSFTKTGVEPGDNLYGGTGKLNAWETTKNNNSVKITA
ncbi:MAG: hypothetical protein ACRC34_02765, partial [Cetobacterium sp.]